MSYVFVLLLIFASRIASAEVSSDVTQAIGTTKTDSVAVAALMLGIAAALLTYRYIRNLIDERGLAEAEEQDVDVDRDEWDPNDPDDERNYWELDEDDPDSYHYS